MATQAPAKQKITYSAVGGNMDEIHAQFDRALAHVRGSVLGKTRHPFINGADVKGEGRHAHTHSPIDRDWVVGEFACASHAQVDAAVAAAKAAQVHWGARPWQDRVAVLRRAAEAIREHRYQLAAIMSIEVGKSRLESLGDAEESADLMDYYADQVEQNNGFARPMGQISPNEQTLDILRPFGVFAIIAPFNFPLALASGMTSAALLAGNAVVFKPSMLAPLTGWELKEIYVHAGMPDGVFNLLFGGGSDVGERLLNHKDLDGVAFTGSHEVGMKILREVGAAAGRYARPVLGELGGKNAAIVTPTADLDMAAEGIMKSAFGLSGQKCSACSRAYVDERVIDRFLEVLLRKTEAIKIGDPTQPDVYLGPVISEDAVRTFREVSAKARQDGELLAGGEAITSPPFDKGYFVEPTIARLPLDHELFRRELFLPFLSVGVVKSFDQALEESNKVKLGLTGGLFSSDEKEIERFFNDMEAGVLYVNRRSGATTGAWPGVQSFCGWKGSGITGKGGCGPYYVQQFMREQSRTRMT